MIYRVDVTPRLAQPEGLDLTGEAIRRQIAELGTQVGPIWTSRIFLIDTDASTEQVSRIATELLADPVVEQAQLVDSPPDDTGFSRLEVHLRPGVMDPVAASTEMAIRDMGISVRAVRTGRAYRIRGQVPRQELERIAHRVLANPVIESVHYEPFLPERFPSGTEYRLNIRRVEICQRSDAELARLSREWHLFLSLQEMEAIQEYYRRQNREPTDVELETLAQTWSEHCVHKTLKSAVTLEVVDRTGRTVERRNYENLIRDTIFRATMELMADGQGTGFCLSVFSDNAGVIAFDQDDAVCFKVETHNHPSAIEPYGGSATGIGGVIRDILGTGLAARPVANTDVFCVARPDYDRERLPRGVLHPKRILRQVVAGVRDYGNRMGIPTVNGAVFFDDRYLGNPLVFCGCTGLIPRNKVHKQARAGDAIVVMGGRTGRDGIHGATFSSAELTDTHPDEFSHAVQIGNAITEKKMADVVLAARDRELFTAITDCGAGGLSSAVGEMGRHIGAAVDLEKVPLKYAGLRYDEIWISEAQERMVLAVPPEKVPELLELALSEDVEATVIGRYGTENAELILRYQGQEVGRLSMEFLHEGLPKRRIRAVAAQVQPQPGPVEHSDIPIRDQLLAKLAHPNIASKHWIIRQYDHEVQGGAVIKPLTGPYQIGPSDAAVLRPKLNSYRGIALGCGLWPQIEDPYDMAIASIDEAVRNVVAVGADPARIALLDNFCWPTVDDERTMGALTRACEACYDAAKAYRIPFISGKDSLNNQFTDQHTQQVIRIPNTLLISSIAVLQDVRRCVSMDLKRAGNLLCLVEPTGPGLIRLAAVHRAVARLIGSGLVASCHDVSDGGLLVAVAEMCIASGLGAAMHPQCLARTAFDESPGRYVLEISVPDEQPARRLLEDSAHLEVLGTVRESDESGQSGPVLRFGAGHDAAVSIEQMKQAWLGTLDW